MDENRGFFWEKVQFWKYSTQSENFKSETGGKCIIASEGMDAPEGLIGESGGIKIGFFKNLKILGFLNGSGQSCRPNELTVSVYKCFKSVFCVCWF